MENHKLQNLLIVAVLIVLVLQVTLSAILLVRVNFLALMVSSVQNAVAISMGNSSQGGRVFNAPIDGAPILGATEAKVTIVVFSDFTCGPCAQTLPTVEEVVRSYPNDVRLVHFDFPLNPDPQSFSVQAANAARCAGEQGRYWEMHDLLFAHQDRIAAGEFLALGKEAGLEETAFAKCLAEARYTDDILEDQRKGLAAGVAATPTIFINGQALEEPVSGLRQIVEKQLDK
jgi:protein-disulfide isomerase